MIVNEGIIDSELRGKEKYFMLEIKGKYNTAKVFTDNLEESGRVQIERLCDQPYAAAIPLPSAIPPAPITGMFTASTTWGSSAMVVV